MSGQGTWETTLKARDIDGNPVGLLDASAVFFYDTVLNITWLGNWNAGAGSSYDNALPQAPSTTDGLMNWPNAMAWANSLTVGRYSGWRLPRAGPLCASPPYASPYQCPTGEIGKLWYTELGNTPFNSANSGPFTNVKSDYVIPDPGSIYSILNGYWTGTDLEFDTRSAYMFLTNSAYQGWWDKQIEVLYAVAVRDGDVAKKYTFSGFLPPINLPPTVNTGKPGSSFPFKWTLADLQGATVSDLAAVKSITYKTSACSPFTIDPTGASNALPSGSSKLHYDQSAQQYVFSWKSPSESGCYVLFLTLNDGEFFGANVMLGK